jgi:hypothetical protein
MSRKKGHKYEGKFLASIADNDYQVKSCITVVICQPTITGRNIASLTPCLPKNRQGDPPRISRGYPRDRRFLLKRLRVISFSFYVDAPLQKMPLKTSPHNQQKLLKKWGNPDFDG